MMPFQGDWTCSNPQHWANLPNAGGMTAFQAWLKRPYVQLKMNAGMKVQTFSGKHWMRSPERALFPELRAVSPELGNTFISNRPAGALFFFHPEKAFRPVTSMPVINR